MEISIVDLKRNPSDGLVVMVMWHAEKTVGEHTARVPRATQLKRGESFIEFETLSEETVKGWVRDALSEQEEEYLETTLDLLLSKMANPDEVPLTGKPW